MCGKRRTRARRRSVRPGFTLMEVLLVLAILVILGALVMTNFSGILAGGKVKAARAQLTAFEQAIDIYQLDIGSYPTTQQGLQALRVAPADLPDPSKWTTPYLKKDIPPDPWGNPYYYELMSPTQYKISSAGPDGATNTADDIVNVSG
ncbi:MAG: type II secretion system major pseudopilin GspG [Planctomycetaceae bacterium]|nr:type II secretion system major pseudopilin GspG [Planctomycetaceae bacterium]